MHKIVRQSEGAVRQTTLGKSVHNLITNDISPAVSLATTEAVNYSETETTKYNRIYYVLAGKLELVFENKSNMLHEGDTCLISKGTTYKMQGTFKAIIINQPAFGSIQDD